MMVKYYICLMHQLTPHIKELLLLYDCVILPGFGGFVSADVSAHFDAEHNRFIAPSKEISFNNNLKHNDGLLCQVIMKSEEIDFKSALNIVESWVDQIKAEIKTGNYIIDGVGELFLNENDKLSFKSFKHLQVCKQSFGLSSFYFPELSNKKEVASPQISKEYIKVGSMSRWLAAASIFIMLLLFSRPTSYNDMQNAFVGMSLDTIIETLPQQAHTDHIDESSEDASLEKNGLEVHEEVFGSNVKLISIPNSTKEYHVIIASLSDRSQADLYTLNYCLGTFDEYQILENGKRHRVSVKVFNSKEEALPYLENVRSSHPFFKDAWILTLNK